MPQQMSQQAPRAPQVMRGPRVRTELSKLGTKLYDRKTWSIYDTGTMPAAGVSELEFFKQFQSQGTSSIFLTSDALVKNIADTNMRDSTLVKGENLAVHYITVQIGSQLATAGAPSTDTTLLTVADALLILNGVLEITRANDAIAFQMPLWKLPAGGGLGKVVLGYVGGGDAGENNNKAIGNGAPFADNRYPLGRNPIVIRAQESFGVKIKWGKLINPQSTTAKWIMVGLEGEMWKEVY